MERDRGRETKNRGEGGSEGGRVGEREGEPGRENQAGR